MTRKIEKVEVLLIIISTFLTLIVALGVLRWLQPSLLGIRNDLVLVQSSKEIPPFYEHVFRKDDLISEEFILNDPIVKGRARPLVPNIGSIGPNDLLGFRNVGIPNNAEIIIIGDSQTYGNNALMWNNWPNLLAARLPNSVNIYSMATGGWGAVQYLYAFTKALAFYPKNIVVAFYTGNDALETFSMVYGTDTWNFLAKDKSLKKHDAPRVGFPAPKEKQWPVTFPDGTKTVFTPELRHSANLKHPAIDTAYGIMGDIAREMANMANERNIHLVFTIIPTKELVYYKKLIRNDIALIPAYQGLINDEQERINYFSGVLSSFSNVTYVDLVESLQEAALGDSMLYPPTDNGHPVHTGYEVIAKTIYPAVIGKLSSLPEGLVRTYVHSYNRWLILYIQEEKFWIVDEIINKPDDESLDKLPQVDMAQFEKLIYRGHTTIDDFNAHPKFQ